MYPEKKISKHSFPVLFFNVACIVFLFFFPVFLFSQTPQYSIKTKSAIKHYEKGLQAYELKQNNEAIEEIKLAIEKDSNFVEAFVLLASVYEDIKQPQEAISNYVKSFSINPDFFPVNYMRCGELERKSGHYQEALNHFEKYLSYPNISVERKKQIEENKNNCKFAIEAMKHPVEFFPENLGSAINTKEAEYFFTFTVDQQNIIFTRKIADKQAMFGFQEDFFMSTLKDDKWTESVHLPPPINTTANEGAPSISADGKALFFTICNADGGKGSCDIYLSQFRDDLSWTKPMNLGAPINTSLFESQPSFSSDGKTLYFSRKVKTGNKDNIDIYFSVLQKDMTWSEPKSVGDKINTFGNEGSVFIHPDNQTLYFSSDGHSGMGGLDIFISRRQPDGEWGEPVNLGYPINTFNDENSFVVSADGLRAYFASDRPGGFGGLDIYVFDLYKEARPLLTSYVKGRVYDALTKNPLAANYEIIDVESGKVIFSNTSDKAKGEFFACLPEGKSYMLNVNKEQYLFYSENFECRNTSEKQQVYNINIALNKPLIGETVVLKNIFFDINKFDLKTESYAELNKLLLFLGGNEKIKVEISGHTDNSGEVKNNQILSENRAKSVYDYLIQKGISPARLTFKGYGESLPLSSNETEEGRSRNRRTVFRIISM